MPKRRLTERMLTFNKRQLLKNGFIASEDAEDCVLCHHLAGELIAGELNTIMHSSGQDEKICNKHARLLQLIW